MGVKWVPFEEFDDDVNSTILDNWERDIVNKQRRKGFDFERELVHILEDSGVFIKVKRAPGSDGTSLGETHDVDILADGFKIQAKRRKTEPKWLNLGNCHFLIHRSDRDKSKITMELDLFLELYEGKEIISQSIEERIIELVKVTVAEIKYED